eukprot:15478768-Alexandrium_andersonii.AAC.1
MDCGYALIAASQSAFATRPASDACGIWPWGRYMGSGKSDVRRLRVRQVAGREEHGGHLDESGQSGAH